VPDDRAGPGAAVAEVPRAVPVPQLPAVEGHDVTGCRQVRPHGDDGVLGAAAGTQAGVLGAGDLRIASHGEQGDRHKAQRSGKHWLPPQMIVERRILLPRDQTGRTR
jgi:hypothetical protein